MLGNLSVQVKQLKRNVCNTSRVSKHVKPLNVSKTVCSNTTGRNVFKVSSVNQLAKPSTVNKPVFSNDVQNVRNINSISQLVILGKIYVLMQNL